MQLALSKVKQCFQSGLVCSTEEEWKQLAESFKNSKNEDEKTLYETLSIDFVPEIPKIIERKAEERKREEQERQREKQLRAERRQQG